MVSTLRQAVTLMAAALALPALGGIEWGPCDQGEFNTALAVQCASIPVPMDYTDKESKTFDLEMVRVPAPVQPARGTIQHNFGGPGLAARQQTVQLARVLQALSGGAYDLLAFDPRGTGKTLPFTCTGNNTFFLGQWLNEIRSPQQSDTALARLWARARVDANICATAGQGNETAEYIGTAFTARDFMSVVDALGEPGLYYWGFSYGTTLGATLAAMFPDRIEKMIIDGVQNPHEYYYANADFEEWSDTDAIFTYYFETCIEAGPEKCTLAALNKTASELESDTMSWFDQVRDQPMASGTTVLDLVSAKAALVEMLKSPTQWPTFAAIIGIAVYGTEAEQEALWNPTSGNSPISSSTDGTVGLEVIASLIGIHCGDRVPRLNSVEELTEVTNRLQKVSRLQGDVIAHVSSHCARWPWHAKEVYQGDFQVKTKNPVMLAGNIRDAHTPLRSMQNVSEGFEGSAILAVDGVGHSSLESPSLCLVEATSAYWLNGTLPAKNISCEAAHPWDGFTWGDVLQALGGGEVDNETSVAQPNIGKRYIP